MWIFPVSFLLSVSELWMKDSLRMSSWALAKHRSTDLIFQTTYWLVEEIVDKLHSAGLAVVFLPPALVNLSFQHSDCSRWAEAQFILSLSIVVILWTRPQDSYWSAGSWTRSDRRFITELWSDDSGGLREEEWLQKCFIQPEVIVESAGDGWASDEATQVNHLFSDQLTGVIESSPASVWEQHRNTHTCYRI